MPTLPVAFRLIVIATVVLVASALLGAVPSATQPRWAEVAPGVWKTQVGKPESLTLLGAAGVPPPAQAALAQLPKVAFPLATDAIEASQSPAAGEKVALEVRHYGEAPGRLSLYDDDGETFNYEHGEFSHTQLSASKDPRGTWQGSVTTDPAGRPWSYSDVKWVFMAGQ